MDPLTLAAITGGFAAVKSAVQGVRTALNTAEDVGAIAGQIDRLFKTHSEAKKRIDSAAKDKKLKNNKWAKFVKFRLKDDGDDETSLANVAAAKLAQKQQEEDIKRLSIEINKRFGAGTWDEVLEEQQKRIEERTERIKKEKKEQEIDKMLPEKQRNAHELFIVTKQNDVQAVNDMNGIQARVTKKQRQKVIEQKGSARDSDFLDNKLKIQQQANRDFISHVKGK